MAIWTTIIIAMFILLVLISIAAIILFANKNHNSNHVQNSNDSSDNHTLIIVKDRFSSDHIYYDSNGYNLRNSRSSLQPPLSTDPTSYASVLFSAQTDDDGGSRKVSNYNQSTIRQ